MKTAEEVWAEIAAAEAARHREYEAKTVATRINDKPVTIAELRAAFDTVSDKTRWKNPWAAAVPAAMVALVTAAVEWFHATTPEVVGVEPLTGKVLMRGSGYNPACD